MLYIHVWLRDLSIFLKYLDRTFSESAVDVLQQLFVVESLTKLLIYKIRRKRSITRHPYIFSVRMCVHTCKFVSKYEPVRAYVLMEVERCERKHEYSSCIALLRLLCLQLTAVRVCMYARLPRCMSKVNVSRGMVRGKRDRWQKIEKKNT